MHQVIERVAGRVRLMVGRALLQLVNDAAQLQAVQVQLRAGEVRDNVERFQNYGFTSHPFPGAECIGLAVGGSTDHVVVIACDDRRYRLTGLAEGEVAIYTDEGDSVILKRGRTIQMTAGTKVEMITPLVHMTGDLHVDGNTQVDGNVNVSGAGGISAPNGDVTTGAISGRSHTHGDAQGGVTGPPN